MKDRALRTSWRSPASLDGGARPELKKAAETLAGLIPARARKFARMGFADGQRRARRTTEGRRRRRKAHATRGRRRRLARRRRRARDGGGQVRVRQRAATPNRYDGWDLRFRVVSDEPTVEK
jgi:hypothetical protein